MGDDGLNAGGGQEQQDKNLEPDAASLDEELRQFARRIADRNMCLVVALYFQANPDASDTPEGLARRIGADLYQVEEALSHLSRVNVLTCATLGAGAYAVYSLTKDPEVKRLLTRLSEAYHGNPQARTEIVRGIMTGWRTGAEESEWHDTEPSE